MPSFSRLLAKILVLASAKKNCLMLAVCLAFSSSIAAVQPLGEGDLESVSASTGQNVLNLYGVSAGGIQIDSGETKTELSTEKHKESGEVLPMVNSNLLENKDDASFQTANLNTPTLSERTAQSLLSSGQEEVRTGATSGITRSETRFKSENFRHESTLLSKDSVQMNRDLVIDRLTIDNLAGDAFDDNRSAGSIAISNWRSQGQTTISTD